MVRQGHTRTTHDRYHGSGPVRTRSAGASQGTSARATPPSSRSGFLAVRGYSGCWSGLRSTGVIASPGRSPTTTPVPSVWIGDCTVYRRAIGDLASTIGAALKVSERGAWPGNGRGHRGRYALAAARAQSFDEPFPWWNTGRGYDQTSDRVLHPNSACRCFVHRCLVHRAGGSIRNR